MAKTKPQQTSPTPPATVTAGLSSRSDAANTDRLSAGGGGLVDAGEVAMVRRSSIAPLLVCGLCGGILREATTLSECLHSFCGKCISERFKVKDEDNKHCPTCNIDLGCDPKLRADRSLQCIGSVIFPAKRKMEEFSSLHPELVSLPSLTSQAKVAYHSGYKIDIHLVSDPMNTVDTSAEGRTAASENNTARAKRRRARARPRLEGGDEEEKEEEEEEEEEEEGGVQWGEELVRGDEGLSSQQTGPGHGNLSPIPCQALARFGRDPPEEPFLDLDDVAEGNEWGGINTGVEGVAQTLQAVLATLQDGVVPLVRSVMARSREKSLFIRREAGVWDHLSEERQQPQNLAKQLAAAKQRIAELTLAVEKEAVLRAWEANARQKDADEAKQKLAALIEQAGKDGEEAAQVRRERDELRQSVEELTRERNQARREAADAKKELVAERDLKIAAEGTAARHAEEVSRLRGEVTGLAEKLTAVEVEKREVGEELRQERDEHKALGVAIRAACECDDDIRLSREHEPNSLATLVAEIPFHANELAWKCFQRGIQESFAIAKSHYSSIDLEAMSQGFAPGYTDAELDEIWEAAAPLAAALLNNIEANLDS